VGSSAAPATFDLDALARALEAERVRRGLSHAALARATGVAASTIRRFAHGNPAATEADGVLQLVRWLGVAPDDFVRPAVRRRGSLLDSSAPKVRADATALGLPPGSRTTIANLAAVAAARGVPIASLTRGADW
jgi:transcriptional regulator with XRE-family HTH domain